MKDRPNLDGVSVGYTGRFRVCPINNGLLLVDWGKAESHKILWDALVAALGDHYDAVNGWTGEVELTINLKLAKPEPKAPPNTGPITYEIINPSDPYAMVSDDYAAATVAVILLGNGQYALRSPDGEHDVPLMFLGGEEAWCNKTFGKSMEELLRDTPRAKIAEALESVKLVGQSKPSSLNNIGKRAKAWARKLRQAERKG